MITEVKLRPFVRTDAQSLYDHLLSDPSLHDVFDLDRAASITDAYEYIDARQRVSNRRHFHDYAIILQDELIGEINAAYTKHACAAVGYVIAKPFRNQGYAKQALTTLLEILKNDGVREAYGAAKPDNTASIHVMKACGMSACDDVPEEVKRRENETDLIFFRTIF